MKKHLDLYTLCLLLSATLSSLFSQNVAINEDGAAAHSSALLDIQSSTKGLLAPRMTTLEKEAIDPAAIGLIVYDINENDYYFYNGVGWSVFGQSNQWWKIMGTDLANLNTGNVTIGNGAGEQKLHIFGNAKITDSGNSDGKLFIGTTTTEEINAANYSLLVGGSGIMTELKINLTANWPDYVFSDQYRLMPIHELERHIDEHGHLPGIPSAEQISKEEGFFVGELQRAMLEKLEELTLYVIELKKENEQLQEEIAALKAKIHADEQE